MTRPAAYARAMTRRLAGLALVVAAATGCGGDGPAKPKYVERANAVCARASERIDALPQPELPEAGGAGTEAFEREEAAYLRKAAAVQRDTLAELRAIPRPAGDEQRLAALYDELERAITALERLPADEPGDPADDPTKDFERRARAYGLTGCTGTM